MDKYNKIIFIVILCSRYNLKLPYPVKHLSATHIDENFAFENAPRFLLCLIWEIWRTYKDTKWKEHRKKGVVKVLLPCWLAMYVVHYELKHFAVSHILSNYLTTLNYSIRVKIGSIEIRVNFWWRIPEGKRTQEKIGVDGNIILKLILNKIGKRVLDSSGLE